MADLPGSGGLEKPEISPLPSPNTEPSLPPVAPEGVESLDEPEEAPGLRDEPEIPQACLSDLAEVLESLESPASNYPKSSEIAKVAPDNFRYLYAEEWSHLPEDKRQWGAVAAVEELLNRDEEKPL